VAGRKGAVEGMGVSNFWLNHPTFVIGATGPACE